MEFEINTTFYLDEIDKKEILETISKGYSVEYAVEDFIEGLDDCNYYLALMVEKEIVDYFKKMLDKWKLLCYNSITVKKRSSTKWTKIIIL